MMGKKRKKRKTPSMETRADCAFDAIDAMGIDYFDRLEREGCTGDEITSSTYALTRFFVRLLVAQAESIEADAVPPTVSAMFDAIQDELKNTEGVDMEVVGVSVGEESNTTH